MKENKMAVPLSPNVAKAIEILFPDESKKEVVQLLIEKCADNLPNHKNYDAYQLEDTRFQVLMISEGNIEKLYKAVQLANEDFRDILRGDIHLQKYKKNLLGVDLERNTFSETKRYQDNLTVLVIIVSFISTIFLKYKEASIFEFIWVIYAVLSSGIIYTFILILVDRNIRKYCGIKGIIPTTNFGITIIFNVGFFAALGFIAAIIIKPLIKTSMYLLQ
jgi:hypothetical protein